jgi:hypothetical protein
MADESPDILPTELRAFLHSCIESIPQVEILMMLRGSERARSAREVASALRVPSATARRDLDTLAARGLLALSFAAAFALLSVSYMLLGMVTFATEWRVYVFVVRLLAFCLILYGIFDKNRR